MPTRDIYSSYDPRELPLYSVNEAGHFINIPPNTLRSWVQGRSYDNGTYVPPIIKVPDEYDGRLSFNNLVEAHILVGLRRHHNVSMSAIRKAMDFAEREMNISNLLLRDELRTGSGDLFWIELNRLVNLSKSGQIAIRKVVERYLRRIDRDMSDLPTRLYPLISPVTESKEVVIDPRISFGQPTVRGSGVPTAIIVRLIDAGEEISTVAREYGISESQVSDAILYERAA